MADKMIREEDLRDDFLSALAGSQKELRAPAGFTDDVMKRIRHAAPVRKMVPYMAPWWLKWGIPTVALVCLAAILAGGSSKDAPVSERFGLTEKITGQLNSWLILHKPAIQMPDIQVPDNMALIIGGLTALLWSFWFLFRYLNKKTEQSQKRFTEQ